jgi:hypothetical protein
MENMFVANAQLDNDTKSETTKDNMTSLHFRLLAASTVVGYEVCKIPNDEVS